MSGKIAHKKMRGQMLLRQAKKALISRLFPVDLDAPCSRFRVKISKNE